MGPLINSTGEKMADAHAMADEFNTYFTKEDNKSRPQAERVFKGRKTELLTDLTINEDMVLKALSYLQKDKAPGSDELSPRLWKEFREETSLPITMTFQMSLLDGEGPEDWRDANVYSS